MNEIETNIENIDLSAPAPVEEPMRQYYFIKKGREYVKAKKKELGRRSYRIIRSKIKQSWNKTRRI